MFSLISTMAFMAAVHGAPVASNSSLLVSTAGGTIQGFINSSAPSVVQFLGIPFALPPTGPRRWLPPTAITDTTRIEATSFGPSCPQFPLSSQVKPDVYSSNQTEFFPFGNFSEDCLTLNVWVPARPQTAKLPVVVWFFGGGFVRGGTDSLYYDAAQWIQRTQGHLIVSVNFRSNIFGFPNAAGLDEQNLGLLDQRAALEWVRANIGSFGGDDCRIVAWGQSAGAIAIDYLNFAFPDDPITSGSIMDSGTTFFPQKGSQSQDTAQANFTQVATLLDCGAAASQIDCLRNASWQSIEAILFADDSLKFLPVPDERIVFSNYTARYEARAFAFQPAIIGTNAHEFNALMPDLPGVDALSNATFLCTAATTSRLRQANGLETYRYRYDGDFANISPPDFPGAYHAAELPLIFGTAGQYHGASTPYENLVSTTMQDLWLEFAQDPQKGLQRSGWGSTCTGKAVLLGDADEPMKLIDLQQLDDGCP